MIRLSLADALVLYTLLVLGFIFLTWLFYVVGRFLRDRSYKRLWVRCRLCACEYDAPEGVALTRCPRCASLNEKSLVERMI
ncbi:MAG: hypothetical protein SNJ52_01870 [Verrucomicrobiia bacterium]